MEILGGLVPMLFIENCKKNHQNQPNQLFLGEINCVMWSGMGVVGY
jgi:hypothetical protein